MLPFTHEMYEAYKEYMSNKELHNLELDYNYAIAQNAIDDESTKGDFNEIKMLKEFISSMMNEKFSEHEQYCITEFKKCLSYDEYPKTFRSTTKTEKMIEQFKEM